MKAKKIAAKRANSKIPPKLSVPRRAGTTEINGVRMMPRSRKRAGAAEHVPVIVDARQKLAGGVLTCMVQHSRILGWMEGSQKQWDPPEVDQVKALVKSLREADKHLKEALAILDELPEDLPIARDNWVSVRANQRLIKVGTKVLVSDKGLDMVRECGLDPDHLEVVGIEDNVFLVGDGNTHKIPLPKTQVRIKI